MLKPIIAKEKALNLWLQVIPTSILQHWNFMIIARNILITGHSLITFPGDTDIPTCISHLYFPGVHAKMRSGAVSQYFLGVFCRTERLGHVCGDCKPVPDVTAVIHFRHVIYSQKKKLGKVLSLQHILDPVFPTPVKFVPGISFSAWFFKMLLPKWQMRMTILNRASMEKEKKQRRNVLSVINPHPSTGLGWWVAVPGQFCLAARCSF